MKRVVVLKGDGRTAYAKSPSEVVESLDDAHRFDSSEEAIDCALRIPMAKVGVRGDDLVPAFPWVTDISIEEVE